LNEVMGSGASSSGALAHGHSNLASDDNTVYEVNSADLRKLADIVQQPHQSKPRLVCQEAVSCPLPGALGSEDDDFGLGVTQKVHDLTGDHKEQDRRCLAGTASGPPTTAPASEASVGLVSPKRRTIISEAGEFFVQYKIGKEVMPTTNTDMSVHFATRLKDGVGVVVKVRGKAGSFGGGAEEEREWRQTTERLLNLPDCEGRCKLLDVFEDAHRYYVVMERVGGLDLCEYLERSGDRPLPPSECKEILRRTLDAVAELHSRGLIHKDLKLENVMVDVVTRPNSPTTTIKSAASADRFNMTSTSLSSAESVEAPANVKLIDFDTVEEYKHTNQKFGLRSRTVVGTDQYIAQEAYGGWYSPASDIFAIGVIAYRLLTGGFPFHDDLFDDEEGENWVGSAKMQQIQRRLKKYKINYNHEVFKEDPTARSFCEALLAADERKRPSALEALRHAFLSLNPEEEAEQLSKPAHKGFFHLLWRH